MSEYQYVAFRAIDRPVAGKDLAYMQKQSSRAEITPWSFVNEYHYGDFHGNAREMLRRGYDIHVHYANFGVRTLMIRLPQGLPNAKVLKSYLQEEFIAFLKDPKGPGGILSISPSYDAGSLEDLWEIDSLVDRLLSLRAEILDGDLRPLYLANLALGRGYNVDPEEGREPPVPAGLSALTTAQKALAEFYGLADALIAAAAQESPPLPKNGDAKKTYAEWIKAQSQAAKDAWLVETLQDSGATARAEMLAKYRADSNAPAWPTRIANRTLTQLEDLSQNVAKQIERKAEVRAARLREKRLVNIAKDPKKILQETERLVKERSSEAYAQIAERLAELREALSASGGSNLAEKQAQKLKAAHPTLKKLVGELRKKGFLPK